MIELAEQDGVAVLRLAHGKVNAMSMEFCEALIARSSSACGSMISWMKPRATASSGV